MTNEEQAVEGERLGMLILLESKQRAETPAILATALGVAMGALCEVQCPGFVFDDEFMAKLRVTLLLGQVRAQEYIMSGARVKYSGIPKGEN